MRKRRYVNHIVITIAVMLFIFVQSAMPGHISGAESSVIAHLIAGITGWNEELLSVIIRKAAHFTEFMVLGICLSVNMRDMAEIKKERGRFPGKYRFAAWFIGTVYALTDEFHQLFVPDRVGSLTDVCIDSAGVACGVLLFVYFSCARRSAHE